MLDGPQPVRVLHRAQECGVVPVRLHCVAGDDRAVQRQLGQQRPEVADLVRLAGLGDLVLRDHDAGGMGDGGEQVDFLLPAGLRALALLAVHGHGVPGRDMPRIPRDRGIQPRVQRVRPEPAVLPLLAEAPRRWRLLLPLLLLLPQLLLPLRGGRGRDLRGQRRVRQRRGQGSLELIRVQALRDPVQRPRRRRDPQPRRRADPATVGGQQLLVPARSRLRDRQRPAVPGRRPCHRHRDQRRQLVPDPVQPSQVRQPPGQRLPEPHRIRRRPGREMAADALDKP